MPDLAVIIPAAGASARFGERDKLLETLHGISVIARSVGAFVSRDDVRKVVIATRDPDRLRKELPDDIRLAFAHGGDCREHSVQNALALIDESFEWIAIHDAARPLVSQQLIDRTFAAAIEHGAAVPALPVSLTIKQAASPLPARVERTLRRAALWAMQTPQIMRRRDLREAFSRASIPLEEITDDAQLLEMIGLPVWLVAGEERNLKLTTPLDLKLAELLLKDV